MKSRSQGRAGTKVPDESPNEDRADVHSRMAVEYNHLLSAVVALSVVGVRAVSQEVLRRYRSSEPGQENASGVEAAPGKRDDLSPSVRPVSSFDTTNYVGDNQQVLEVHVPQNPQGDLEGRESRTGLLDYAVAASEARGALIVVIDARQTHRPSAERCE